MDKKKLLITGGMAAGAVAALTCTALIAYNAGVKSGGSSKELSVPVSEETLEAYPEEELGGSSLAGVSSQGTVVSEEHATEETVTEEIPAGGKPVADSAGTEEVRVETGTAEASSEKESSAAAGAPASQTTAGTTAAKAEGYVLTYSPGNSWDKSGVTMYGVEFMITNNTAAPIDGWNLKLDIEGLAEADGWNGSFVCDGNTLSISDAGYNAGLGNGGSTTCGCNLGVTAGSLQVKSATLNGTACTVVAGAVDQNAANNNNDHGGNSGQQDNGNNNGGNAAQSVDVSAMLSRSADAVQGDDWLHTDGRRILDSKGNEVWLTGLNWFGYNTGTNTFDGLWNSRLAPTVKAIADHGFNLIRVPMSAQLLNEWAAGTYPRANYNNAYNTELNSMNSLEIFDYFLALAEANGIKVMIDIHSAETDASGHNVNLWHTSRVSDAQYLAALSWAAERYKDNDTIIAFDLKNEPHGKPFEGDNAAIWNDSRDANNWKYMAERAAMAVLEKNPNVLVMVEGIEIYPTDIRSNSDFHSQDEKDYYFNWWGGNLRGVKDYPVNLGKYQNKLVYSPHDYGPTVYEQPWFEGSYSYDSLMADCWKDNWFYIYEDNTAPLLIGEWGGFMREPNLKWMTCMRQLISTYHLNHTFWCLNANSGDTGGLLMDDFTTWDSEKYEFVKEVLWQKNGKFVGLDHRIPLGENGTSVGK